MSLPERRRPEDFLELVERSKRGRLKVYLGFAAGVGKTYRMLQEAHDLKKRSVDVVIGFVEPHGRAETAALVEGLETVPRKKIEYRGVALEDLDVDAVLARKPQVALVDEIAHTNAPGSRHRRRYEDVVELIGAGVNVICAFNVQHLESLNSLIERATGVVVRETVPDTFLNQADQVVTLDLTVEDLLDRLKAGKIYDAEKVSWALEHFFKEANLTSLRELVLREVAESVERGATAPARSEKKAVQSDVTGRVMVCMSSFSPRAAGLLRRGSRTAGRLATDWYVAYVETPAEAPNLIDAQAQRYLHDNIQMARDLGAEVVRLKHADPAAAILEFARSHNVRIVIVGRSLQPAWRRLFHRDVVQRIIDGAAGLDVHLVSFDEPAEKGPAGTP
jgi:two-component system, OmpR family, sensor histidine kinase KdpD